MLRAQTAWPERPIRLVVPWPPGGSTDTVARIFQPRLQEILG
ncbi:tripartite tricarboxylate transporter substrate binding protein, partial [Bacillus paranthracis]|nr:tripartite tricarboxylate transporter substrate binding protein [Bacillus paranthracis]